MYIILDFIRWALTHAKPSTIPAGAKLPLPLAECGAEPWQYLFGSVRVQKHTLLSCIIKALSFRTSNLLEV